jgi:hypothetical protein
MRPLRSSIINPRSPRPSLHLETDAPLQILRPYGNRFDFVSLRALCGEISSLFNRQSSIENRQCSSVPRIKTAQRHHRRLRMPSSCALSSPTYGCPLARRAFEPHLNGASNSIKKVSVKSIFSVRFRSAKQIVANRPCTVRKSPAVCTTVPESGAERMLLMIYFAYPINEEG